MTTDILEINDFVVLIDSTEAQEAELYKCQFEEEVVGISFYGSGQVHIEVHDGKNTGTLTSSKGVAFAYYGNQEVRFSHQISQSQPLQSISIFITLQNLHHLPLSEKALFDTHLSDILTSNKSFALGPRVLMTPAMHEVVAKVFSTDLRDTARALFLKSQVLELLAHYFGQIEHKSHSRIKAEEIEIIHRAKDIIVDNMAAPPSLGELSKLVGINSNKLKTNFKQIFGVSVFKYLQGQRLGRAYQLLQTEDLSIQEAAWQVGYESLSSFSNAFHKQYGFRPSEVSR